LAQRRPKKVRGGRHARGEPEPMGPPIDGFGRNSSARGPICGGCSHHPLLLPSFWSVVVLTPITMVRQGIGRLCRRRHLRAPEGPAVHGGSCRDVIAPFMMPGTFVSL